MIVSFSSTRAFAFMTLLGLVAFSVACGGGSGDDDGRFAFDVSLVGLPDSQGQNSHYEGWAVLDGVAISTGKFRVIGTGGGAVIRDLESNSILGTAAGATFGPSSTLLGENFPLIVSASHFFITIEPEGDRDQRPSCQVLMAGVINDDQAMLTSTGVVVPAGFPCAIPTGGGNANLGLGDLTMASGVFQLRSFTDADPNNEFAGAWFVTDDGGGGLAPGLNLPVLPGDLRYEGWAIVDGEVRSLGGFSTPDERDDDAHVAPQRGSASAGPGFPGQDFAVGVMPTTTFDPPALDLTTTAFFTEGDWRAFITIEPALDNDDAPFQLRLLESLIPATAMTNGIGTTQVDLESMAAMLPTATVAASAGAVTMTDLGLVDLGGAGDRRGHFELWQNSATATSSIASFVIAGENVTSIDGVTTFGTRAMSTFNAANTGAGAAFPDPLTATEFFITFEDEDDLSPASSGREILAGAVNAGQALLDVAGTRMPLFGADNLVDPDMPSTGLGIADFVAVAGSFRLATPTDRLAGVPANDQMGILFADVIGNQTLELPFLPAGWKYEGWVENDGTGRRFSTGKFELVRVTDESDGTSLSRGPDSKPGAPGEDFLFDVPALTAMSAGPNSISRVFVTIEAHPRSSPGPSSLIVLDANVPVVAPATDIALVNVLPPNVFSGFFSFTSDD